MKSLRWTFWALFVFPRICSTWQIDCLSPTTTLTEALERRKRCCVDELMKGARCCQTLIATAAKSGFRAMLRSTRRQRWIPSHRKEGLTSWGSLDRAEERLTTKGATTQERQEHLSIIKISSKKSRRKPAAMLQRPSERAESRPKETGSTRLTPRKLQLKNLWRMLSQGRRLVMNKRGNLKQITAR